MSESTSPTTTTTPTTKECLDEARRELKVRESKYPEWVRAGKLSYELATTRLAIQKRIVAILDRQQMLEEVSHELLQNEISP